MTTAILPDILDTLRESLSARASAARDRYKNLVCQIVEGDTPDAGEVFEILSETGQGQSDLERHVYLAAERKRASEAGERVSPSPSQQARLNNLALATKGRAGDVHAALYDLVRLNVANARENAAAAEHRLDNFDVASVPDSHIRSVAMRELSDAKAVIAKAAELTRLVESAVAEIVAAGRKYEAAAAVASDWREFDFVGEPVAVAMPRFAFRISINNREFFACADSSADAWAAFNDARGFAEGVKKAGAAIERIQ